MSQDKYFGDMIISIHDYDQHEVRFLRCPKSIEDCSKTHEKIEEYIDSKGFRTGNIEWMLVYKNDIMIQDII